MTTKYKVILALVATLALAVGLVIGYTQRADKPAAKSEQALSESKVGGSSDKGLTAKVESKAEPTGTKAADAPLQGTTEERQRQTAASTGSTGKDEVQLDQLPSDMVIVSVDGRPVTVGAYRRMFKLQQLEMQNSVNLDPAVRLKLLQEAQQRHVQLTQLEQKQIIEAARRSKGSTAEFKQFLKQHKATEKEFDEEMLSIATAYKTINVLLQQNLLNDIINRELLAQAAKAAGLENRAMQSYVEFKHSKKYQDTLKLTGFTPDELRDEKLRSELTRLMAERVKKRAALSDKEIKDLYNKNKKLMKHKDRIRLSQILIAAPTVDQGSVQSVRTQVRKANPKYTEIEVDARTKIAMTLQQQKALDILNKVKAGADFAQLANQFTDDLAAKNSRTGGDLGFQNKEQLIPEFAKVVWPMKAGQVVPKLVQTPLGFHVVKVTAKEGAGAISYQEAKPILEKLARQQAEEQALARWLTEKRQTAKIALAPKFAAMVSAKLSANGSSSQTH